MSIQLTINLTIYCIILLKCCLLRVRTHQLLKIIGPKFTYKKVKEVCLLSLYLPNGAQNYWALASWSLTYDFFFFLSGFIYLFIYSIIVFKINKVLKFYINRA